jgi:hypothetical protein
MLEEEAYHQERSGFALGDPTKQPLDMKGGIRNEGA